MTMREYRRRQREKDAIAGSLCSSFRDFRHLARWVRWSVDEVTSGDPAFSLKVKNQQAVLSREDAIKLNAALARFIAMSVPPPVNS